MFGYVVVNKQELKFREFDVYCSYYCGLCRELKERYGLSGQISLTYDMTFLILLLSGLYEPPTRRGTTHCALHPIRKQTVRKNSVTEYAADMNILLVYYKCMDDWKDEKKLTRFLYGKLLEGKSGRAQAAYRRKADTIISLLRELSQGEAANDRDMDRMAGFFGRIMAEIFAYREDEWEQSLRRMGFYFGKFIYLLDAYEDVEKDVKNGNYNPFSEDYIMEGFEEKVRRILVMMMAETCREFEKLPVIQHGDILRNILYSGVWCRFEKITGKRKEAQEKKHVRSI